MIDITKCPRDKEVDTWFNEEFERQKVREPIKVRPLGGLDEQVVLKDADELIDEMMADMEEACNE